MITAPVVDLKPESSPAALWATNGGIYFGRRVAAPKKPDRPLEGQEKTASAGWDAKIKTTTPHLLASCETEMADAASDAECADLLNRAGGYFLGRAAYSEARPLFERALAIREKVLGPEHPDTAGSLNNLGGLLQAQGDLAGARPLCERARAIEEKVLGAEHPNTNRGRHNFARLLLAEGNAAEALRCGEAALAAHQKTLGENHPWTKDSARVVADARAALRRAEEAAALRARYGLPGDNQ